MFAHHPDTFRPDQTAPGINTLIRPSDQAIAVSMSVVMLRQAGNGYGTTLQDFLDAPETKDFEPTELERNLGRAREMVDPVVVRQDDPHYRKPEAGQVHGVREATVEDELSEATDDQLLDIATAECGAIVTDDAIVSALLQRGLRPAAISRIWTRLTVRIAAKVAQIDKPTIGSIARAAKVA